MTISDSDKEIWLLYFDQNTIYRAHALLIGDDVSTKIDAASGTIKGKLLNALMSLLNDLGPGVVEIHGDRDAVWWFQDKERQAIVNQAFYILYKSTPDEDPTNSNGGIGVIPSLGIYGDYAAVGQRTVYCLCGGFPCSCSGRNPFFRRLTCR